MKTSLLALIVASVSVAACSEGAGPPLAVDDAVFARPGSGSTDADSSATFYFPGSGYDVVSDGAFDDTYADGVCGVDATVYDPSGDAVLSTENTAGGARQCPEFPRELRITYRDANLDPVGEESVPVFLNVQAIGDMAPGESALKPMNVGLSGSSYCESLRFRSELRDGTPTGADDVVVTRNPDGSWTVENTVDALTAACFNNDVQTGTYEISVSFLVEATGAEN